MRAQAAIRRVNEMRHNEKAYLTRARTPSVATGTVRTETYSEVPIRLHGHSRSAKSNCSTGIARTRQQPGFRCSGHVMTPQRLSSHSRRAAVSAHRSSPALRYLMYPGFYCASISSQPMVCCCPARCGFSNIAVPTVLSLPIPPTAIQSTKLLRGHRC